MAKQVLIAWLMLLSSVVTSGQEITGRIVGVVIEKNTQRPLEGIAVMLSPFDAGSGTETDADGWFEFKEVEVGLYDVAFLSLTHTDHIAQEVWVRSGKESVLDIVVEPRVYELSDKVEVVRYVQPRMGTRSFTVEQSLRYAATFSDPARLITSYPGVANVNDQANHFSVRGNNPNANKWLIEGLEVVSPNHLSTAGTPNDLPTLSGGGVNILSAQMLRRSDFHNGVLPGEISNATGGIMDMRLRKGNNAETEWTAQAGLIGIDIANEGPISKEKGSSYLVNYRYSTLGLLSAMGVDLGDEQISFQDLSAHLNFPLGERIQWKVFGMGGISQNEFAAIEEPNDWEFDKDSSDVDHDASVFTGGSTLNYSISDRASLEFGVAYSKSFQRRKQGIGLINESDDFVLLQYQRLEDRKLSGRLLLRQNHTEKWSARYGITVMDRELESSSVLGASIGQGVYTRPFTVQTYRFNDQLTVIAGLAYSLWSLSADAVIEPSVGLEYNMSEKDMISIRVGQRAQTPDLQIIRDGYEVDSLTTGSNYDRVDMTRSIDLVLGYDRQFDNGLTLRVEWFYQELSHIPGSKDDSAAIGSGGLNYSSTLFNNWNGLLVGEVGTDRNARMIGGELSVSRSFRSSTFYNANVSVFESTFGGEDGASQGSRWDIGYTANLSGGKEFVKVKEGVTRTWGVSGRLNFMGGAIYTPFVPSGQRSFISGAPYSAQYDQFYRLDLRVYLKKDKEKKTGMWSLDLQNATNARNGFYDYYDTRKQEVVTKYQLGIIPNLSYRIEF
jgi:hypothetical protein